MPKITARVRLTKREVDKIAADGQDALVWDVEVPGFGLRVRTNGRKQFVFQYFIRGRTRRINIGEYGPLTAETARERARTLKQRVQDGNDPAADRDAERRAEKMSGLCERYLKQHAEVHKKPGSQREDRYLISTHILPALGNRQVVDITRAAVTTLHHSVRDTPYTANRMLAVLSKMMNLAERWGMRPDGSNPCRHVERYRETKRQRISRLPAQPRVLAHGRG